MLLSDRTPLDWVVITLAFSNKNIILADPGGSASFFHGRDASTTAHAYAIELLGVARKACREFFQDVLARRSNFAAWNAEEQDRLEPY